LNCYDWGDDMNEIYMDIGFSESRIAVMDEGALAEIYIERQGSEMTSGNIYKGRVENVLPGMQSAFVNIGLDKNAFLYIKDAVDNKKINISDPECNVSINEILKVGDEILVQVSKEPAGTKGARVTTHITLPGRYVVLMPNVDYIGISRRIENEEERERLKNIMMDIKPEDMGIIIRTESEGKNTEDFMEDINFLKGLWDRIKAESVISGAPRLIHRDMDIVFRTVRDLFSRDTQKMIINDRASYKRAVEIVNLFSPSWVDKIHYYDSSANILDFYGVDLKIEKALSQKVWLKNGGYLVIDQTEALTSIDVNTGRFTGSYNLNETVVLTNIEAAREIARQLRLRDIGGIIIIDFIDMNSEEHKLKVIDALKSELKKDRTKSTVFGITQLGLVEMTRKKMGKRLSAIMQKECPMCSGSGRVLGEESVARKIERELQRVFKETDAEAVLIEVNDEVARYILSLKDSYIKYMEQNFSKKIIVKGLASMEHSDIKIKSMGSAAKVSEHAMPFEIGDKVEINVIKTKYLNNMNRNNLFNGRICDIKVNEDGKAGQIMVDISE
jgi:ribonuclease, Rne/Rng family